MSLGMKVMIDMLCGGDSESPDKYVGLRVKSATLLHDPECIDLTFENGQRIRVSDDGQSCCERRYMSTDDDLSDLVGGKLVSIETKDAPSTSDSEGEMHEIVFLEIATDKARATVASHVEHNGYYGGFSLMISDMGTEHDAH